MTFDENACGDAGAPSTRGFHVMGWEADHAAKPLGIKAEDLKYGKAFKVVLERSDMHKRKAS